MDLASIGYLDAVKAVKLGKKRVWVFLYVIVIVFEYLAKEFVFGMMNSLDDVLVVAGEIEEAATLAGRAELREDVFAGQGHEVVGRVQLEDRAEMTEDPRGVVFELEVVLGGRRELVAGSARGLASTHATGEAQAGQTMQNYTRRDA